MKGERLIMAMSSGSRDAMSGKTSHLSFFNQLVLVAKPSQFLQYLHPSAGQHNRLLNLGQTSILAKEKLALDLEVSVNPFNNGN